MTLKPKNVQYSFNKNPQKNMKIARRCFCGIGCANIMHACFIKIPVKENAILKLFYHSDNIYKQEL